jgi:molybdenum cofactor synthesis domain-containing protein
VQGRIVAVCISDRKGQKQGAERASLVRGHGLAGDVHAGYGHRQVSLLEEEKIDTMRAAGLELAAGAFGENLVTRGFDLGSLTIGRRLRIGERAVVQLTQRGKECHTRCSIFHAVGDCIMPTQGMFARVLRSGTVTAGDTIAVDAAFDRLRLAVITLSDRAARHERGDATGPVVAELLGGRLGGNVVATPILPDDRDLIEKELARLSDEEVCDLIVTTGGTGLSPRDVTPEATRAVIDREVPGMAEAMRAGGLAHTPRAMLSRSVAGQRGTTLIVNLSGSPRAAREQLEILLPALPHALETSSGIPMDCGR